MMQLIYRLDLAIIQFSSRDHLSALHTNRSIFFTFTSTTMNEPSIFFLQNSKEVIIFHQLTNQNSPGNSIDIKFQEWSKVTSANVSFQMTAFQRFFNVSYWVYAENNWKKSFFNVVFSRHENFVMQSYMEHFKALVSNIQFFRAKWCKYFIGLIS